MELEPVPWTYEVAVRPQLPPPAGVWRFFGETHNDVALRRLAHAAAAAPPAVIEEEETVEYEPGKRLLVKTLERANYHRIVEVIRNARLTGYSRVYLDTRFTPVLTDAQHERVKRIHGAVVIGRMVYLNN
jgi:hypothetical protein